MSQQKLSLETAGTSYVECLGQTFPNEEARREHFLKLLAAKLKTRSFGKPRVFPSGKTRTFSRSPILPTTRPAPIRGSATFLQPTARHTTPRNPTTGSRSRRM